MQKIIYISYIAVFLIASCSPVRRSVRTGTYSMSAPEIIGKAIGNNISNHGFNIGRADIFYNIDGVSGRFIAGIRYSKPDTLLIILRHSTGVEIGRIYLNNDTLLVNDRINRRMMYGDPVYLADRYGIDRKAFMTALGDLVINDPGSLRNFSGQRCQKGIIRLDDRFEGGNIAYGIDCEKMKVSTAVVLRGARNERIDISYSNYIRKGGHIIPGRIEAVDLQNKAKIRMEIKSIDIPWEGRIDFIPGNRYKPMILR